MYSESNIGLNSKLKCQNLGFNKEPLNIFKHNMIKAIGIKKA